MAQDKAIGRFMDGYKEPTKTLTPIKGYEKCKLVSLEEAINEIQPSIDDVDTMVWTAKRNSRNPTDNLTSDESASVHLYTLEWPEADQSMYALLNQKLRSEKRRELVSWHSYLKLFLTALYKLPSLKKTVWRGIRGNVNDLYQEDFIWWGVSSCTETMKVMERFIGLEGERTIFMIDCVNGKAIKSHSFYKDENEIVLMPGTYLRVVDKWSPARDLHMIRLQEETPPCTLVAPPFTLSSIDHLSLQNLSIIDTIQSNDNQASASGTSIPDSTLNSNEKTVSETNQSNCQALFIQTSSIVNTSSSNKITTSNSAQSDHKTSSFNTLSFDGTISSLEPKVSTASQSNYPIKFDQTLLSFDPYNSQNAEIYGNNQSDYQTTASTTSLSTVNNFPSSEPKTPMTSETDCQPMSVQSNSMSIFQFFNRTIY